MNTRGTEMFKLLSMEKQLVECNLNGVSILIGGNDW